MPKKAKKALSKTKSKNIHPRSQDRGWLVLGKRWKRWIKEFFFLIKASFELASSWFRPKRKRGRPKKRRIVTPALTSRLQAVLLIIVGLIFISYWTATWWEKGLAEQSYRTQMVANQLVDIQKDDPPHPVRVVIPWYVDVATKDGYVQNNDWTLLDKEAVYLAGSARPGHAGNIIIYGHNTREVMGNIRVLKGYETIKLILSDGTERFYKVKGMYQVKPDAMEYLQPTETETLTIYTCTGWGDTERFVVQAVPTP